MATATTAKNGTRRVQFTGINGVRKTITLGKVPVRFANDIRDIVEQLLQHLRHAQPLPAKLSERLAALAPELQQKLAATGLIDIASEHRTTVSELLDAFAVSRETAVKASTATAAAQAIRNLRDFFGDVPVDKITVADAEAFLRHLQTTPAKRGSGAPLAPDTVHRRFKTARTVFETAVRDDLIGKNPFKYVKAHGGDLTERQEYIPVETVLRVINAATSIEWQLLIALSRFAGVRVPSEPRLLRWSDIDLASQTMRITSPKTEGHAGRKYRTTPITADLLPFIEAVAATPHELDDFVFSESIRNHTNLATMLQKLLKRLKIAAWAKLWHNLRFSCYSDFVTAGEAPANVSKWLGNTDVIGLRHYHDATSAALTHATTITFAASQPTTAVESPAATTATVELKACPDGSSVELCGDLSALGIILDAADESDASIEPGTETHSESHREQDVNHVDFLTQNPTQSLTKPSVMERHDEIAESVMSADLRHMTPHHAARKTPRRPLRDSKKTQKYRKI